MERGIRTVSGRTNLDLPKPLAIFAIAASIITILCCATEFYCVQELHLDRSPYNRPTLAPADDFADMRLFVVRYQHFHDRDFFSPNYGYPYQYPAPVGLLYLPFERQQRPVKTFLETLVFIYCGLTAWFCLALRRRGIRFVDAAVFAGVCLLFSYPFFFEANRANVEIFVWLLACLGVLAFVRDRPWLAAVLIGLAGACKGYPYIYLGLFFAQRKYLQMAGSIAVGVVVNLVSTSVLAGNFAAGKEGIASGLNHFREDYVLRMRFGETGLDHSIFGFIKRFWVHLPPPLQLAHTLNIYVAVAALAAGLIYLFRVTRLPAINQVIFLTAAAITLPPTSFDYTLLHVYTPWVLVVLLVADCACEGRPLPAGFWAVWICFILLLTPQNELIYHGQRVAGQFKCLVLLVLGYLSLRYPFNLHERGLEENTQYA